MERGTDHCSQPSQGHGQVRSPGLRGGRPAKASREMLSSQLQGGGEGEHSGRGVGQRERGSRTQDGGGLGSRDLGDRSLQRGPSAF